MQLEQKYVLNHANQLDKAYHLKKSCQTSSSNKKLTYKGEDYFHRDYQLFWMVYNLINTCIKNNKEIGKVRFTNICYDKCNYSNSVSQFYPYEYEDEIYCSNKN